MFSEEIPSAVIANANGRKEFFVTINLVMQLKPLVFEQNGTFVALNHLLMVYTMLDPPIYVIFGHIIIASHAVQQNEVQGKITCVSFSSYAVCVFETLTRSFGTGLD